MFRNTTAPIAYQDPWDSPLSQRILQLRHRNIRVAYYYQRPDTSTFRYRAYNMVQTLNDATTDVSAAWFCEDDLDQFRDLPSQIDVLVVARCRYSYRLDDLISRARTRGCRVIYDSDDLVFDAAMAPLLVHTVAEEVDREGVWDYWFAYTGRIQAAMKLCDRVTVTNDFLAQEARSVFPGDVRVIPNFLNREQLAVSRQVYDAKVSGRFARDATLHLGYFSGSPSHNRDFEIVSDSLARLFDDDRRLRLVVVGFLEMRGRMTRHADRVERHGLLDFLNLQLLIGATELNLVPLQSNRFTNCKSELKYFEAGAVGTVSVASPTFAVARAISAGQNGFLARVEDWEVVLREAVATLDGRGDEYIRIATEAYRHSVETYAWDRQAAAITAAVLGE